MMKLVGKKKRPNPDMYQGIIIEFVNEAGNTEKATFWGRAVIYPAVAHLMKIRDVSFTEPQPLPEGCKFEVLE